MGGFLQGLASTVGTLADAAGAQPSAKQQEKRQDDLMLRERQADELEKTISALSADTTLSAQEKTFRIGEARKAPNRIPTTQEPGVELVTDGSRPSVIRGDADED